MKQKIQQKLDCSILQKLHTIKQHAGKNALIPAFEDIPVQFVGYFAHKDQNLPGF